MARTNQRTKRGLDSKLDSMDQRMTRIAVRVAATRNKLKRVSRDIDRLDRDNDEEFGELLRRVTRLEAIVTEIGPQTGTSATVVELDPVVSMGPLWSRPLHAPAAGPPGAGDRVWDKATGEGPFVLVASQRDQLMRELPAMEGGGRKIDVEVDRVWLVKDRRGRRRVFPLAELTTERPTDRMARFGAWLTSSDFLAWAGAAAVATALFLA